VLLAAGIASVVWALLSGAAAVLLATSPADEDAVRWFLLPLILGAIAAAVAWRPVRNAGDVITDLPAISSLASAVGFLGMTVGAVTAAVTVGHLPTRIAAVVVAVVAAVFTVLRARSLRGELADTRAERERIDWLHAHGKRVRADVVEVGFPGVWADSQAVFLVGAEYTTRSGTHRVDEQLLASVDDAPVVGGTVLLWTVADDSDPRNVLMEVDRDSIRHPDPTQFLSVPDPHDLLGPAH
jgi:hypothetical protein